MRITLTDGTHYFTDIVSIDGKEPKQYFEDLVSEHLKGQSEPKQQWNRDLALKFFAANYYKRAENFERLLTQFEREHNIA